MRSPWSEAAADIPPLDDSRMLIAELVRSDAAAIVAAITTVVTVVLLVRLAWLALTSTRRWMRTTSPAPPDLQPRVDAMAGAAGFRRPIRLRLSAGDGPLATGLRTPLIVLPAATREDGSDDWAVAQTSRGPFTYAHALLQSARLVVRDADRTAWLPDPVASGAHPMGKRLARLLDGRATRECRFGPVAMAGVVLVAGVSLPGAHMPRMSAPDHTAIVITHVIRNVW